MNPAELGGAIAMVGTWVQLGGTILPLMLFFLLARHAGSRPYFLRWMQAWGAMVVAILAVVLRYRVSPTLHVGGPGAAILVASLHGTYLFAKLCFFGLLVAGVWELVHGQFPVRRPWLWGLAAVALAAWVAWGTESLTPIIPPQALAAVAAFLFSAWLLWRLPPERLTLGTRFTSAVLFGMACLWTVYGGLFFHFDPDLPPSGLAELFPRYSSYVDTAAGMLLAFGMVVILLEDARREAHRARAEHLRAVADAEAHLAESLRMESLGRLVSGVAHELNNPLAAILTFSEQLLHEQPGPDLVEPLATIRDQARRARAVVRDLLTFVRRREERREWADVEVLVQRTTRALAGDFERQGVTLTVAVEPGLPPLLCDPPAIEQVLTNLLDNAARAARGGVVALRVRREREMLVVEVEDNGPGIPAQHLVRIFEPFFTTRGTGEGTGLGLSVSLGITEQHGGSLRAENREPGPGARFLACFPLDRAPGGSTPPRGSKVAQPLPKHAVGQALIIDDEAPVRASIRRYLERTGWQVTEAANGTEGLGLLLDHSGPAYTLVLCDLKMPGLSGQELYRRLETSRPEVLRRLVFASGDTASPDTAAFLAGTACAVLEKPFELSELAAVVRRISGPNRRHG